MTWTLIALLSIIQGLTEYLPISSSAHLILPAHILNVQDQGIVFDVAVHLGSLFAIVLYFHKDLLSLGAGTFEAVRIKEHTTESKLVLGVFLATIPVSLVGLAFHDWISDHLRSPIVIAYATIGFGLLLGLADSFGKRFRSIEKVNLRDAWVIGMMQVLALIPGTSRSGITMTAGRMLGLTRPAAARFSFLLAMPVIGLSAAYQIYKLLLGNVTVQIDLLMIAVGLSFMCSLMCVHLLINWIQRIGFWPFVWYRFALGGLILYLV